MDSCQAQVFIEFANEQQTTLGSHPDSSPPTGCAAPEGLCVLGSGGNTGDAYLILLSAIFKSEPQGIGHYAPRMSHCKDNLIALPVN